MADIHMLLVYNLAKRALDTVEKFDDGAVAMSRYFEVEREHFQDPTVEIVLVAADSEETIKYTHRSYFTGELGLADLDVDAMLA